MKRNSLAVCLMGPTASGKTDLAIALAERFSFEIVSVDSALIYRGMDIGTAKPDKQVLAKYPHHLTDIRDPIASYSAADFCHDAVRVCTEIVARGRIPLLVGGTMMYFRALQQGLADLPPADEAIRASLSKEAEVSGWAALHQRLQTVDPDSAARIHAHDTQRIQRALEVYEQTGKPLSSWFANQAAETPPLHFANLLLVPRDRAWLHERIARRFEHMVQQGLVAEVQSLLQTWPLTENHPAMRSVGYRQVLSYLQGEYDEATLLQKGIAATRQLAKRQLTWLRHWPDGTVLAADDPHVLDEMMAEVEKILDNNAK